MTAKKIKIFVDAHSFDTEFQGAQTFIRELYSQLMDDHPELEIYFGTANVGNFRNVFPDVPVDRILPYKKNRFNILRFIFDIPRYIKRYQFDFAHFQYIAPRRVGTCKYIITLHDVLYSSTELKADFPFSYRFSRNLLFGQSIKRADIKTTVSPFSKAGISACYNIPEDQIHIIPNAVTLSPEEVKGSTADAVEAVRKQFGFEDFILCTSRLEPRKNQDLILKVFLQLGLYKTGTSLVFVGKKSIETPDLDLLIEEMTPEQRKFFHWFPQVGQNELNDLYRACRLFIYPSKAEGFGIPPLEAGIRQVPVLCSSATAMKDFAFFQPNTFDPRDEKEFTEKLTSLLAHPPSASHLSQVAVQIDRQYSWKKSSGQFYNLLLPHIQKQTVYETEDSDFGYAGNP